MTITTMVWWLAGNAVLLATVVVCAVAEIVAIRRGRRRMADFRHAFAMLALYVRDEVADPGRPLPLAVTEYLQVYNTPGRRRRRAL